MNLETRVQNLEKNFDALIKRINNNKFYTDADISGTRQGIAETEKHIDDIAPFTATQSASCGDTEVVFEDVPQGLIICEVTDSEGNEIFYNLERSGDTVTVDFEPLEYAADVTISIQ